MQIRRPVDIDSLNLLPEQRAAVESLTVITSGKAAFKSEGVEYIFEKTGSGVFFVHAWAPPAKDIGHISNFSPFHDTIEISDDSFRRRGIGRRLLQTKIALAGLLPYETANRWDKMSLLTKFGYAPIALVNRFVDEHKGSLPLDQMIGYVVEDGKGERPTLDNGPYRLEYNPKSAEAFAAKVGIPFDVTKVPKVI